MNDVIRQPHPEDIMAGEAPHPEELAVELGLRYSLEHRHIAEDNK